MPVGGAYGRAALLPCWTLAALAGELSQTEEEERPKGRSPSRESIHSMMMMGDTFIRRPSLASRGPDIASSSFSPVSQPTFLWPGSWESGGDPFPLQEEETATATQDPALLARG